MAWGPMGQKTTLYHGPNKVPAIAGFESLVDDYCNEMARIGMSLIDAFEVAFDLNGLSQKFASDPSWLLMCVSYPPTPNAVIIAEKAVVVTIVLLAHSVVN